MIDFFIYFDIQATGIYVLRIDHHGFVFGNR